MTSRTCSPITEPTLALSDVHVVYFNIKGVRSRICLNGDDGHFYEYRRESRHWFVDLPAYDYPLGRYR